MLELAILGSGSSGNSALVCLGETRILIDAGLSARQLCLRLENLGVDPDHLNAIVLTHEHGDHTRGIDVFCRKRSIPIYGTTHTCAIVRENVKSEVPWHHFEAGDDFIIEGINVESFSVPHDAVDPVGFIFRCTQSSVGIVSDVGHVTRLIIDRLKGVNTLFVESNYDEVMLQNDTHRPWSTKQRISNRHGHLSNDQAAGLVSEVASSNLTRVVLGHLSNDCNAPELARQVILRKLESDGHPPIQVDCAMRKDPLPLCKTALGSPNSAENVSEHFSGENSANPAQVCDAKGASVDTPQVSVEEWSQTEWAF